MLRSGGCAGADRLWAEEALKHGHQVQHFIFPGWPGKRDLGSYHELSQEWLNESDKYLYEVAKYPGKHYPKNSQRSNNYLRRDIYVIYYVDSLYAVGYFYEYSEPEPGKYCFMVESGTGWGCMAYKIYHPEKPLYFFEQNGKQWYQSVSDYWIKIDKPPRPTGTYGGIGSRRMLASGKRAIKDVYN